MSTSYAFDRDTASEPVADTPTSHERHRTATLTDRWHTPNGSPNGGYTLATILRALGADAAHPDPLVAAATYLRPASPGDADIFTTTLQEGRRIATYGARLTQAGKGVVQVIASFTDREGKDGPTLELGLAPDLPPPDACPPFTPAPAFAKATIADQLDYRFATPPAWQDNLPSGNPIAEYWVRFSDGRPIDWYALALLVDAYPPAIPTLADVVDVSVQLTVHFHRKPTTPWIAGRVSTRHLVNGYHEEDMELWDADGALLAQSRQLVLLTA